MKQILAPRYGIDPKKVKTKILGIRPGEKLIEDLMNDFEIENALETNNFFIIPSPFKKYKPSDYPNTKKPNDIRKFFHDIKPISKDEVRKILKQIY